MSEKMPTFEDVSREPEAYMDKTQIEESEKREGDVLKIESDLLEAIKAGDKNLILGIAESSILPTAVSEELLKLNDPQIDSILSRNEHINTQCADILFDKYLHVEMDRPNNFLLLGLVRNKNLSPEKQLVIANLDEESGTPHSHSSIADFKVGLAQNLGLSPESAEILVETRGIGWVKTNLARNKAVSLDVVHRAVDGFGLGMNGQSPFEYALFEEFRNGDRNPRAMDKTLVSIIKQIREEEDRLEGDRNNISDRLMLEENYFYLRSAAYQIEERAKAILETQPIEKLSEVMDISVEDFEKYVKPLLEKKQ